MAFDPVSTIVEVAGKVLDKIFPDPIAQANARLELLKLQQNGELASLTAEVQLATNQTNVNAEEAKSQSTFVAGWRPFIGWVCGTGLASQFLVAPFLTWAAALAGHPIHYPSLDIGTLLTLLLGMLGLSYNRTQEKINGINSGH